MKQINVYKIAMIIIYYNTYRAVLAVEFQRSRKSGKFQIWVVKKAVLDWYRLNYWLLCSDLINQVFASFFLVLGSTKRSGSTKRKEIMEH
jgi:hypothetical protein